MTKLRFMSIASCMAASALLVSCTQPTHSNSEVDHAHGTDGHSSKTQKPGAGLQFSYSHDFESQLNQSGSMTLRVKHPYDEGQLLLEMVGSNGVEINHGSTTRAFTMSKSGVHSWNVSYRPTTEGTGYVSVVATVTLADGSVTGQAYSVPIQTGTVDTEASTVTEIIMEAEEEIIQ